MEQETLYLVYIYDSGGMDSEIPIAIGVYDDEITALDAAKHNTPEDDVFKHNTVTPIKVGQLHGMEKLRKEQHRPFIP